MRRLSDYPKQVDIGDSIWRVRFVDRVPANVPGRKGRKPRYVIGLACPETQTLYILKSLSPHDRLVVFIHEVTHALEDEHGFEIEHSQLEKLDKAWAKFLCDNFFGQLSTKQRGTPRVKVTT